MSDQETIEALNADLKEISGEEDLAEALVARGWAKPPVLTLEGEVVKDQTDIEAFLLRQKAKSDIEKPPAQPEVRLAHFSNFETVEILNKNYDWVPGNISSIDAAGIHVNTDRGPVTIRSTQRIRKVVPEA